MKTLKQLCKPRSSVFDRSRRDTVLDLTNLIEDKINPEEFFAENYLTDGMKRLLREAFRRFEGTSNQGVFVLTQAMGGGKTHNMIGLGLLANHPKLRQQVLGDLYQSINLGKVRVVGFTGRESDAPLGIWGAIAEQLGKKELFKDYYSPLSAPGQTAWVNLLKGDPLLILLDELPPYFEDAKSKAIGNSGLARVTTTALSNLLVAVGKDELANVCVVISDLKATYEGGSQQIIKALEDLKGEVGRGAITLEPVGFNTDEVYHILRKRLFEELPEESEIWEVARAYAQAVRDAKQMDITNASPDKFAAQIRESYPFHFAIRDLYARFRENPSFQMVRRGELRLLLGTDAASEGLNLQRLGTLINLDLPWNPTRLEQRKGRIQRIGQLRDTVYVYNMRYKGSVEDRVHELLSERLAAIHQMFGQIPDILEDVWIEVAMGEIEHAKQTSTLYQNNIQ